jgi:hypothetical protein
MVDQVDIEQIRTGDCVLVDGARVMIKLDATQV